MNKKIKTFFLGKSKDPQDSAIFHKLSLIAFFAWVGLGADGLSSSCYGPQEAFRALHGHPYLSIFVALGTVLTIFVISQSYSQIVELFPSGGGGYLVASKLLSPAVGMLSGCALLIDYCLTIAVSIASGADAVFSLLPVEWHSYRLIFAVGILALLIVLNMRGVKESVLPLVPIFLIFLLTHIFIILYAFSTHVSSFSHIAVATKADIHGAISQLGFFGMIFLILRAYSMGAGTYTGLEAVSNGIPVLRDPKVKTAKHTMTYMAISLSVIVMGLMFAYLFYGVTPVEGKTFNAILLERATSAWSGNTGFIFILVTLVSEATLLFVAAQTGFLDGPRVLANMAIDRWFPTRFSHLSDRLVTTNGILIIGGSALLLMLATKSSVQFLVVLYSINVFLTFVLSQIGMVKHWWIVRSTTKHWRKKLLINGIALILSAFILISMVVFKFFEGGWITLLVTGTLVVIALAIRRHYHRTLMILRRLNHLVVAAETSTPKTTKQPWDDKHKFDQKAKTAVVMVNGFNGTGLHTLFGIFKLFGDVFKNFVFVQIGVVDAGNFKGAQELEHLETHVKDETGRYVSFVNRNGYYGEGITEIGVDAIEETIQLSSKILKRFPNAIFFSGQLIFPKDTFFTRQLHNYTVFTLQRKLYREGVPFVILPIRV